MYLCFAFPAFVLVSVYLVSRSNLPRSTGWRGLCSFVGVACRSSSIAKRIGSRRRARIGSTLRTGLFALLSNVTRDTDPFALGFTGRRSRINVGLVSGLMCSVFTIAVWFPISTSHTGVALSYQQSSGLLVRLFAGLENNMNPVERIMHYMNISKFVASGSGREWLRLDRQGASGQTKFTRPDLVYHSSRIFQASRICNRSRSRAAVTDCHHLSYRDASKGPFLLSTTSDVTRKSTTFSFSSSAGEELIREALQDLWSHAPRDHQIEAVAKLLDGTDVLAILPTGAGKTAILIMFMLVLDHMRLNPGRYPQHCRQFPEDPIIVVVYPTNCLEEEQVRIFAFSNRVANELRIAYSGCRIQGGGSNGCGHQCRDSGTLRDVDQGRREWAAGPSPISRAVNIKTLREADRRPIIPQAGVFACC